MADNEEIRAALRAVLAAHPNYRNIVEGIEHQLDSGADPKHIRIMLEALLKIMGRADGR
jgi:hypothetical protein